MKKKSKENDQVSVFNLAARVNIFGGRTGFLGYENMGVCTLIEEPTLKYFTVVGFCLS